MDNFGLLFDRRTHEFIDENSGYILHAENVMINDTQAVIDDILAGTGVEVDDFFIEVMRDTIEASEPRFPW